VPTQTRRIPPEVAHQRATVAGLISQGADPEKIAAARADLRRANLESYVAKLLATTPPLTAEEKLHLTRLLSS
jgi:hypothetical protein